MKIQHQEIQQGCFVFQVIRSDAHIQQMPILEDEEEEDDEEDQFENGELLAIDLIQPGDTATFVRLADQSGWVASEIDEQTYLKQIPVVTNILIPMIADVPQMVRRHPMDETSELLSSELYTETSSIWELQPMQTVYCDAMVEHPDSGIRFYRIQGAGSDAAPATPGWIHDQTVEGDCKLLPSYKVQTGMFAFRALVDTTIRERPDCTNASKSPVKINRGQLVVADLIRESPANNGNGPFLRLEDGSGWLFCKKLHEPVMERVAIKDGHWIFTVLSDPHGVRKYEQPGRNDMRMETTYAFGTVIECDRCIENDSGNYFRVIGSDGWICDREDNRRCLSLLQELKPCSRIATSWTVDFVRGIALAATNVLEEIYLDEHSGILSLQVNENYHFKVFCRSRTVGVFYQYEGKTPRKQVHGGCPPEQLLKILSRSLEETIDYYDEQNASAEKAVDSIGEEPYEIEEEKKDDIGDSIPEPALVETTAKSKTNHPSSDPASKILEEDDLRKQLLLLDAQMMELQTKRREIVGALKPFDTERDVEAFAMREKVEQRQQKNRQKYLQTQSMSPQSKSKRTTRKKGLRSKGIVSKSSESNSLIDKGDASSSLSSNVTRQSQNCQTGALIPACTKVEEEPSFRQSPSRNPVRCLECNKEFSGKYSRDLHCRNVHKLYCEHCDQIFRSFKELEFHMEAENHW